MGQAISARRVGRPLGSTSGRVPPGGYPPMAVDAGGFLAGLIEGEASFSITKQARNTNHQCRFDLTLRADDQPLLISLAAETRLGRLVDKPARNGSKPQVTWSVSAKSDCTRLCEILDTYPLRGRKSTDYAIWSAAVRWWVGGDPTRTQQNRDWTPMKYLRVRLQECKRYTVERRRPLRDRHSGLDHDWGWFLSGFITAEGYIGICRNAPGLLQPRFAIRTRADDCVLLAELCQRTESGSLYRGEAGRRWNPVMQWIVAGSDDLARLVEILDRYPPKGRKQREYEIWREAVIEYHRVRSGRRAYERLDSLRSSLREARTYRVGACRTAPD